jgi:translation initiation factor 3 subunit D
MPSSVKLTHISESYGRLYPYNKAYDRITTKTERPLQPVDRIKYNTTTSDDPVIQQVSMSCSRFKHPDIDLTLLACVQRHGVDIRD